MKTSKLTGAALDWAVAKCEGDEYSPVATTNGIGMEFPATSYSTDWSQGGPIIERENIAIFKASSGDWCACIETGQQGNTHSEFNDGDKFYYFDEREIISGATPLIAAMRCYVASKLGDYVDVPEELTK
jgi:hypothetical protein